MGIRRFGEPARNGRRYRARPGAYAILPRGSSVLITRQEEPESEFQLPGGGIDPGESAIRALHREVLEETGWRISRPRRIGAFRRFTFMPEYDLWAEKICHIYLAYPTRALSEPEESGHLALWFPLELAAEMLTNEGDRHFLSKVLSSNYRP